MLSQLTISLLYQFIKKHLQMILLSDRMSFVCKSSKLDYKDDLIYSRAFWRRMKENRRMHELNMIS